MEYRLEDIPIENNENYKPQLDFKKILKNNVDGSSGGFTPHKESLSLSKMVSTGSRAYLENLPLPTSKWVMTAESKIEVSNDNTKRGLYKNSNESKGKNDEKLK